MTSALQTFSRGRIAGPHSNYTQNAKPPAHPALYHFVPSLPPLPPSPPFSLTCSFQPSLPSRSPAGTDGSPRPSDALSRTTCPRLSFFLFPFLSFPIPPPSAGPGAPGAAARLSLPGPAGAGPEGARLGARRWAAGGGLGYRARGDLRGAARTMRGRGPARPGGRVC